MSDEESTVFRAEDDGTVFQSDEEKLLAQVESLPETPPELEGYELISRLGEGTFGTVWQGKQIRTGQAVAVKLLRGAGLDWKILQRETERLREVAEHPYIVTLLDADLTGDPAYIVMPYLKNGSLADVVSPTLEQVESWLTQIAEALVYAHDKGILHCDIKPSNILLDDEGRARLVDFGQAVRSSEEDVRLGTLGYMPPEQVAADAVPSTLWDIYALGATAYRLLSGQVPRLKREDMSEWQHSGFNTAAATQYSEHLRSTPVEWLHYLNPSVDEDFAFAIMRCLVPSPEKRMQGAAELLRELEKRKAHVPLESARPWKMSYRSRRWVRRNKLVLTLLLVLSVVTGTPLAWYMTDPLIGIPTEAATTPIAWPKLDSEFPEVRDLRLEPENFSSLIEASYDQDVVVVSRFLDENPPGLESMERFARRNSDLQIEVQGASGKPDTLLARSTQDPGWLLTAACEVTARTLDSQGDHDQALQMSVDRLVLGHRYILHKVGQEERGRSLLSTYPGHIAVPLHFLERRELGKCSTQALSEALSSLRPLAEKWPAPELVLASRNDWMQSEISSREFDALTPVFRRETMLARRGDTMTLLQFQDYLAPAYGDNRTSLPVPSQRVIRFLLHPVKTRALGYYQVANRRLGADLVLLMTFSGYHFDLLRERIIQELQGRQVSVSAEEAGPPVALERHRRFESLTLQSYLPRYTEPPRLPTVSVDPRDNWDDF